MLILIMRNGALIELNSALFNQKNYLKWKLQLKLI